MRRKNFNKVFLHAILDGRDTPYNSGIFFIKEVIEKMKKNRVGEIATLAGRFYSMDRDGNWGRTEKSYLAMTEGIGEKHKDPIKAIEESYKKNIFDEQFLPTVILKNNQPVAKVEDNDALIFFNFRTERARQLTKAFVLDDFSGFERKRKINNLLFVTMTEYEKGLPTEVAFPPETIDYPLARVLSDYGLKQLHIAETEKYAHVTYFFNGGREKPYPNEDWVLIPSAKVSSFDQKPEMSAKEITQYVISAINQDKYDFILINFANPDIVGHTGNLPAVISAIETLDKCLSQIVEAVLKKDGVAIITADHGNAEEVVNLLTGEIDKEHSTNPVPFILISKKWEKKEKEEIDLSSLKPVGVLADVAPTILKIMNIPQPKEMTGRPLI
jgi:2,3-bisphosphoglycerate-independent phosphoglycerate mutase